MPYYGERHVVKPGLTGWAQVRYTYGASVEDAVEKLQYDLYNIGSGKPTPNHELLGEIKRAVPNFTVNLPPGRFPFPPLPLMETKRLEADTGFSPKFDTRLGVQDYVAWLKAGNPR